MAKQKVAKEINNFWRRLDLPVHALWHELNKRNEAADSTIEAMMFSLRRGADALADPKILRRLNELSERQLIEIMTRVQKFKPHIAPVWTPEQVEVLAAVRRKL